MALKDIPSFAFVESREMISSSLAKLNTFLDEDPLEPHPVRDIAIMVQASRENNFFM